MMQKKIFSLWPVVVMLNVWRQLLVPNHIKKSMNKYWNSVGNLSGRLTATVAMIHLKFGTNTLNGSNKAIRKVAKRRH